MPGETPKPNLPKRILLIERAAELIQQVADALQQQGYAVYTANDCQEGLQQMVSHLPDLVILDLLLINSAGRQACQRLREISSAPILLIAQGTTAQGTEEDIVRGLDYGADDYLTKPFRSEELLARIGVLLRRAALPPPADLTATYSDEYLTMNLAERRVTVQGKLVHLTRKEYHLLTCLLQNAGRVLTYQQLLERVWGQEYTDDIDYVRVYIWRLRRKIEKNPDQPQYILTEHGLGYRFVQSDPQGHASSPSNHLSNLVVANTIHGG
jgi:two-component system KDP operon response regulator KdpE